MVWKESDDKKVDDCLEKLTKKAQELDGKLFKINSLRVIAGKIQSRTIFVQTESKDGEQVVKPKDDFGVELKDDYRLDQLSKLVTATNTEIGDQNK